MEAAPSFETLRYDVDADGVAVVTLDRADKLNAINTRVLSDLNRAFRQARSDERVRGIVLTGAGDRAFAAGADIEQFADLDGLSGHRFALRGQAVLNAIEATPKPVVAAVNGFALGGGCELALACHLRVASEEASFGLPEVGLGIIPGYGGTVRLPRIVGKGRALEMILTGARITAREAHEIGLVNRVVEAGSLAEEASALARKIAANGPVALGMAIESTTRGLELDVDDALALEANLFGILASTEDMKEGMAAFLEKRRPEFRGC